MLEDQVALLKGNRVQRFAYAEKLSKDKDLFRQTMVIWSSTYESDSNEAVGDLCNPIYQALLAALKSHLDG